jgi:hypothetical protein
MKFAGMRLNRKSVFSKFSRKPSTLAHMLLHKSNINVAIPDILSYKQSLYNHQKPKYKNSGKKGVAPDRVTTFQRGRPNFFDCLDPYEHIWLVRPTEVAQIYRICVSSRTIRFGQHMDSTLYQIGLRSWNFCFIYKVLPREGCQQNAYLNFQLPLLDRICWNPCGRCRL